MKYLPEAEASKLIEEAQEACKNTYSPYSNFAVGAAVLTKDGHIFRGTNVENASYGVTICAERIALGNAISNTGGAIDIRAIAVYTPHVDSVAPCGACRQFIIEFGKDIVVIFKHESQIAQRTIHELLPFEFTRTALEISAGA